LRPRPRPFRSPQLGAAGVLSGLDRAVRRLEEALQFLQREEDRLWFWGVDRSDDPNVSADMLRESGLNLDRRADFPRKAERLALPPEQAVSAFLMAPLRRGLADSVGTGRQTAAAAAGD
jgi:hypothetical protein